jgi:predicted RNA-binding Zn ribbon-like protein
VSKSRGPFDWSGGHPALDLVNSLDERPFETPLENLATWDDLVRFVELAGIVEPSLAARLRRLRGAQCAAVAKRVRCLREHLFDVLAAVTSGKSARQSDWQAIAAAIRAAHSARVVAATPAAHLAVHRWARPVSPETPLHACALAVERLLVEADRDRIRKCGAPDCAVYFVDVSKAHRRQWCSMKNCGNREKQRRWRAGT